MISPAKDKLPIAVVGLGGTISMTRDKRRGLVPTRGIGDLLRDAPELTNLADLASHDLDFLDSCDLRPSHWTRLAEWIDARAGNYAGIVVTHGTDTMAYTAAALALAFGLRLTRSVVLTGAETAGRPRQRRPREPRRRSPVRGGGGRARGRRGDDRLPPPGAAGYPGTEADRRAHRGVRDPGHSPAGDLGRAGRGRPFPASCPPPLRGPPRAAPRQFRRGRGPPLPHPGAHARQPPRLARLGTSPGLGATALRRGEHSQQWLLRPGPGSPRGRL